MPPSCREHLMIRCAASLFCTVLLMSSAFAADVHFYLVDTIATESSKPQGRAEARELEKIYADMAQQSGVQAKLVYSTNPDINAFATEIGSDKIVVVQEGLLGIMGGDRDAVAAVLGHELAHHKADHIRAGKRKQEGVRVLGSILGAVVGAKIGRHGGVLAGAAAGTAVGVGAGLVALKFNRDQEMEADRLSVGWMIAAGYNPDGMLRLQHKLGELEGHSKAAIFSTHPTSAKRYKAAQQQIAKLAPAPELLARPVAPLVDTDALAAATAEIRQADDVRLAKALQPEEGNLDAAALAPVAKVDFDTYAGLQNELLFAGDKGKAKLLAKNHLTDAQLSRATETYSTRMAENPALAQRYSADFFRASQGRLAAYGRDLADSYEKGQNLKLDPPYSLEIAAQIFAEMQKRGAPNLNSTEQMRAETEVLKPQGLSYYDFLIGHNWWSRKAKIALLGGDASIMQKYYGAGEASEGDDEDENELKAKAAAANVQVGENVHMGRNVRSGGSNVGAAKDDGH
jgi:Zn-dependent protease with chaperone function